jgi:peptide chain release factor 2
MLDEIDANIEIKRGEEKLLEVKKYLFFKDKEEEIINLEKKTLEPNFWDNRKTAEKILKKLKILKDKIENFEKLEKELEDLKQYIIMLKETSDDDIMKKEILEEISKKIKVFFEELEKMEMIELLGDKESLNAIVTIHSGAGGKEACDWAQMLYRMYIKWCAKEGYVVEEVDSQEGDGVGFKSVTIIIKGEYASEILKGETGVHRLVRISPFDSSKRRHTSFASVEILPEIEEQTEIEIKDEELRIDTYRASGARWSACK